MKKPKQKTREAYSHRGDRLRRNDRIRKGLLVLALIGAVALIPQERPRDAQASTGGFTFGLTADARQLRADLDAARGELAAAQSQLARANAIMEYSATYRVGTDIAAPIYDVALEERIDPDLAFRLVKVESEFNEHAVSSVGAVGLTQIMPATARYYERDTSRVHLMEPRTNLRVGFRYLRTLIEEYRGDVTVALLVYNRGEQTVESMRTLGLDPRNGYELAVMRGYKGKGTVD
jgi:soluble lytic murein transglycosylase-like protein